MGAWGGGLYVVATQPHQTRVKRGTVAVATALKIGLWADKNPIAPWDWRKGKR